MKNKENEKFRTSPTTLDEAIANLEDPVNSHDAMCGIENRQLLDWLRELRDARSTPVGNSAAMRDVLAEIRDTIMDGGFYERSLAHFVNICDAALSEPARNCDVKYADRVEMYGAFKDWCRARGHTMEPMLAYDAFDWLLAQAEKRKGDGK